MTWLGAQFATRTAISIAVAVLIRLVIQADAVPPEQPLLEPALALPFLGMTWAFGWQIGRSSPASWSASAIAKAKRRVEIETLVGKVQANAWEERFKRELGRMFGRN